METSTIPSSNASNHLSFLWRGVVRVGMEATAEKGLQDDGGKRRPEEILVPFAFSFVCNQGSLRASSLASQCHFGNPGHVTCRQLRQGPQRG
jgi:hypothetical protein